MKMVYASSKDKFKRELDGIQVELQATDPSEMSMDIIKARAFWIIINSDLSHSAEVKSKPFIAEHRRFRWGQHPKGQHGSPGSF